MNLKGVFRLWLHTVELGLNEIKIGVQMIKDSKK